MTSQHPSRTLLSHAKGMPLVMGAIGLGVAVSSSPSLSWFLIGIGLYAIGLWMPSWLWAAGAFGSAAFSRILVSAGLLPSEANFFHYPLALGAALRAAFEGERGLGIARFLGWGLWGLLFLSLLSWLINGGEILKPFLAWIVFAEPFLLLYGLLRSPPPSKTMEKLWRLTWTVIGVQVPVALLQAATLGLSDNVQGTFVGLSQASHVVGAVTLAGSFVLIAKLLTGQPRLASSRLSWTAVVLLWLIPVLADAKHVIAAALGGMVTLLIGQQRIKWKRALVGMGGILLVLGIGALLYPPLQWIFRVERMVEIAARKTDPIVLMARHAEGSPLPWLLGLGPGNTFSRVALMGQGGLVKAESPVARLGISITPITQEALAVSLTAAYAPAATSTTYHIWSSFAGLLGDWGFLGLGLYLGMGWMIWKVLERGPRWAALSGRANLTMLAFLGGFHSWLEEPCMTLIQAFLIGLLTGTRQEPPVEAGMRPKPL